MAYEDVRSTLFRAEEAERAEYERLRRLAEDRSDMLSLTMHSLLAH